jgi:hypothetical protein
LLGMVTADRSLEGGGKRSADTALERRVVLMGDSWIPSRDPKRCRAGPATALPKVSGVSLSPSFPSV